MNSADELTVAIVILNWNGADDTLACLDSFGGDPGATLVVVDNGSTDASVERIASSHPNATLLETGDNLGFSAGNNLGIRWALDHGFDVVGILNNDTIVTNGFMTPLIHEIGKSPQLAFVSPKICYVAPPGKTWFSGSAWHPTRKIPIHRSSDTRSVASVHRSATLTGCALFAHRSIWERVGLLDDDFFLIFEDAEWSLRAKHHGCIALVVEDSQIQHRVSSTIATQSLDASTFYYARNGILFFRKIDRPLHAVPFALGVLRDALRQVARDRDRVAWNSLRLTARGVVDGVRGRTGRLTLQG